MRRVAALVLAAAALALVAPPARAQDGLSQVAGRLRADPVYVDPDAELAGRIDANALRDKIRSSGAEPMFVAVLP